MSEFERIKSAFEAAGWAVRVQIVGLSAATPTDAPRHVRVDLTVNNDWTVRIDRDTAYCDPCPVRALRLAYDKEDSRGIRAALAPVLDAVEAAPAPLPEEGAHHAPVCRRVMIYAPPTDPTPTYYRAPRGTLTAADVIDGWGLDYWTGSVVAHVLRAGRKPGETRLDALRNAAGCLAHAIRVEEGGE